MARCATSSGTLPTDKGYTGQRADALTGLDDYNARSYDPLAGQFTSADTTLAGGLNRYAYVGGNPETRTDPSGHLYRRRDYSQSLALQQSMTAPHVYFSSLSAFVSDSLQYFTGINTLRQSFHTLFQDPHASMGDKVKAAGAAALTVGTDFLTIGSMLAGEPEVGAEVGEAAQVSDAALLAADSADEAAVAASDVAGDVQAGVYTGGDAAADGAGGAASETFYRTMSQANFEELQSTGRVPATSETFISPSQEYAQRYQGTTVRFTVQGGTQNTLAGIGVRDASAVASATYPDMPQVSPGWTQTSAFFKGEGGILNIGLGRGAALNLFNDAILGFEVLP